MPIDIASGSVHLELEDVVVPGSVALAWDRRYSTAFDSHTALGRNWTCRYFASLTREPDGFRFLTAEGGVETAADAEGVVDAGVYAKEPRRILRDLRRSRAYVVQRWNVLDTGDVIRYCFAAGAVGFMDTARVLARFESERQALAMMNHPYIAQALEAGAGDDGRPYFVMELVRGEPVTDYCAREKPSLAVRLKLFLQICEAIQHAHQRGIIHRDLKPSNVLLTTQGTELVPKIIDFGIAKAIGEAEGKMLLSTMDGQIVGTPEYMSPEQAGVIDAGLDTRTDVYSLGVMLYELVSGQRPYELKKRTAIELERALRTPPSAAEPGEAAS